MLLSPILRPYGTQDFCYAFSTHITPLTGRKDGCFIIPDTEVGAGSAAHQRGNINPDSEVGIFDFC